MSGGSFDYLCWKEPCDVDLDLLDTMEKDMRSENQNEAANEIFKYKLKIDLYKEELEKLRQRLEAVMHDWEWYRSGDSDINRFKKSVNEMLSKPN
jgi:thymidylate synthase